MTPQINRRTLLGAGSATLAVGLAGCSAFADGRGVPGRTEEPEDDGDGDGDDGNGDGNGVAADIPTPVHEYLEETQANGYDGEMVDETGEGTTTILCGAGPQGVSFDPVLVNVDPGTEVTWEWTGDGGAHNVVSTESPVEFSSGDPVLEEGYTWSFTFEEPGNYMYNCTPHASAGMHAAVVVGSPTGDGDSSGGE